MGSLGVQKSVVIICGDYMEDYEVIVPFQVLQAFGVQVHCVSPGKLPGHKCRTAVHDFMGHQIYTELPGHSFILNSSFEDITPERYNALIIPGGRFTELLSTDEKILSIVTKFAEAGNPIAATCHSQLVLASAGLLKGRTCTAFPSLKSVIQLAGGTWVDPHPITSCFLDGNIISAIGWPAHAEYLAILFRLLGINFTAEHKKSVLFLCGDYVEDYEINVPFQALAGLGCRVEAMSPDKKKGDKCVTAIHDHYDDEGAQICSEKQGHNFVITADRGEVDVEDYDCLVIPGGRSPEFLVMDDNVVSLVKEFEEKNKVIAAVGQGKLLLAAAGLLKGKKCASEYGMKAIVKVAGGEVVESAKSVVHEKLVTATGWPAMPAFISNLANLLGFTVMY